MLYDYFSLAVQQMLILAISANSCQYCKHKNVYLKGNINIINKWFAPEYADILKSYLENRYFRVNINEEYSNQKKIKAGVPQEAF